MGENLPIFDLRRPLKFHLELTDKCNAACPMCGRTQQMNRCLPDMSKVRNIELDLALIKRNFTPELCSKISEIDLCGGLGDPAAARECIEICDYFIGFDIKVVLSSNGGLRSASWWRSLGELFTENDSLVEFHIDGLKDTNHLYRVNTRFGKIMENATAYLASGAAAEWHFIAFRHNEHQIADALEISRKMGFSRFRVIHTIRFGKENRFCYEMPDGSLRELNPADPSLVRATNTAESEGTGAQARTPQATSGAVQCKSARQNRPYIVATGAVSACCWIEGSEDERQMYALAGISHEPEHNIRNRPLEEILLEEPYRTIYPRAWSEGANPVCVRKCAKMQRSTRSEL
ncbi:MAG: hypothetical protein QGH58_00700 [Arenicellales bacterium]|jgi:molybdenum cofactor biosynthesis enzyme MoaA|nr:hypothetical protein [Arenicellales bacterium]MDP6790402.1 hypothetical protein [Arenicellales bacterium]